MPDSICRNAKGARLPIDDPWQEEPAVGKFMHGWFDHDNRAVLNAAFMTKPRNVLELGAWYGSSTRYILENCPEAAVYSVDIWDDTLSWIQNDPVLGPMVNEHPVYHTFLANMREYRDRLFPMKMHSVAAMNLLGGHGVEIDCVYLDSGHYYEETKEEIRTIKKRFPNAFVCGDDYGRDDCRKGLNEVSEELGLDLMIIHNAWILLGEDQKRHFQPYADYDYSKFLTPEK